ncbi:MAG: hypothetical protein OXH00_12420 [Candidatus Poribacteria bacterium]|nr:hypothetical protein [Candidatus Poribacteria bacterium]
MSITISPVLTRFDIQRAKYTLRMPMKFMIPPMMALIMVYVIIDWNEMPCTSVELA